MRNNKGNILMTVLVLMTISLVLLLGVTYFVTTYIKSLGELKKEAVRFYGSEGGVLAMAAFLSDFGRRWGFLPPAGEIQQSPTDNYTSFSHILAETMRYRVGYETMWRGADVKIVSVSPCVESDDVSEAISQAKAAVETLIFIPLSQVGYD